MTPSTNHTQLPIGTGAHIVTLHITIITPTFQSVDGYTLPSAYLGEFGFEGAREGDVARHLLSGVDPLYRLLVAAVQVHDPPSNRVVSHLATAESHVLAALSSQEACPKLIYHHPYTPYSLGCVESTT